MTLAVEFTKHQAEIVAWICFIAGLVLPTVGVLIGLVRSFRGAERTVNQVRAKLDEAMQHVERLQTTAVAAAGADTANQALATDAGTTGDAAKSSLEQVSNIIGALPEAMRFLGLLVLVEARLMSVATVQFGGHSIF